MTTPIVGPVQEYWLDAWQRSILLLDTLRQRGNRYLEQQREGRSPRARIRGGARPRRPDDAPADQLPAGAHHPARGNEDRPDQAARSWLSIPGPATARASAG